MRRKLVVATVVVVVALVAALQALAVVNPALAGTIRGDVLADAELAGALLTPVALVVAITKPGRS
jgi:hypothetical protein